MRDKRKFEQLTDKKRWKLHELRGQGCSMRTCARELGVNVSTVSRELDRNAAEVGGGNVYLPDHAILCTKGRRARCHPHVKMNDPSFRRMIVIEIQKGRSPEIIAGRLRRECGRAVIGAESLYKVINERESGKKNRPKQCLPRGKYYCRQLPGERGALEDLKTTFCRLFLLAPVSLVGERYGREQKRRHTTIPTPFNRFERVDAN